MLFKKRNNRKTLTPTDKTKLQINIAAYVLVAMCVLFATITPVAYAKQDTTLAMTMAGRAAQSMMTPFNNLINQETSIYQFCIGTYNETSGNGTLPGAVTAFQGAYDTFKAVGFLLAISVTLARLFKKMERGQEGPELVCMSLVAICITGLFIMNIDKITALISELGFQIIKLFTPGEGSTEEEALAKAYLKAVTGSEEGNALWGLQACLGLALSGIGNTIGIYSIYVILITKLVEIALLRMFAPLAVYDIYDEGMRSSGAMYLKNLLGSFLSIAMCVFVAHMVSFVSGLLTSGVPASPNVPLNLTVAALNSILSISGSSPYDNATHVALFVPTIASFATLKMMKSTDEYAKRIVGTH